MPSDDTFLERIKSRSAELAAIRKKESGKRKNQKYREKNKSSIAQSSVQCKRSKKDFIAGSDCEYYEEKNKSSIAAYKHVHWKQHYQNNKESICSINRSTTKQQGVHFAA
jgi:hypothetical protein